MRKTGIYAAVAAWAILFCLPLAGQADDSISLTRQAITELTDPPALGGRTTVDLTKRWGSDISQINKAVALLQDARSQAGGANRSATRLLEEAIAYGKAKLHKEARLSAQGALAHLCKGTSEEGCDKAPKYGAYVAP